MRTTVEEIIAQINNDLSNKIRFSTTTVTFSIEGSVNKRINITAPYADRTCYPIFVDTSTPLGVASFSENSVLFHNYGSSTITDTQARICWICVE